MRFTLVLVIIFSALSLRAASAPAAEARAPVEGVLPNGFRYFILPHTSPKNDISLRFIVNAGSLDEHDDERGFAHFIEHMAFNGTKNHPPDTVQSFFQRLGMTLGPDVNANTSYTHTTYLIDLPSSHASELDEGLNLIRDYADGQLFLRNEVTQESGVVISELKARDSAGTRLSGQFLEELYSGTPVPDRDVIGVAEQISTATPEKLAAFYHRNYVPSRMILAVVGPVDAAKLSEKIAAIFGSMTGTAGDPPAPPVSPPPFTGAKPHIIVVPTSKGTVIEFVAIGTRPPDTGEGRRAELVQRIATSLLNTRLSVRREHEDFTQFGQPRAGYDLTPFSSLVHHSLAISPNPDSWSDGVELLESELRRARTGFSQPEVDEAVTVLLTSLRNRVADGTGQPANRAAEEVARALVTGRSWRTPANELAEVTAALAGLKASEVTLALTQIFPADGLHLVLRVPPNHEIKPDRLLTAYQRSMARPLKKPAAESGELTFRYENFGPPGKVTKSDVVPDLGLTLAEFANGVRLNVRPSSFEPERFRLRIVFPVNYSFIPNNSGGFADLAGLILLHSDLRKHKESEVTRLVKLHSISPQFSVNNGTPVLGLSGPSGELPFALRLLAALLSDLEMDVDHYRMALGYYSGMQHALLTNPRPYALTEALFVYTGKDTRVLMNPPEAYRNVDPDEPERWLRVNVLQGPLEIGIVGDVTPEQVIAAANTTVGALKRRGSGDKPGPPLASPTKATRGEGSADLPASTSMSCVLWPVRLPDDPRHNAALAFATDVLRERLMIVLREVFGATYSTDTRVHRDAVQRDFAYAAMINTFEPGVAAKWTEGSLRLAAQLAEKGVNADEFARLREPLRTRFNNDLLNNSWWLNSVVCTAQSQPSNLEEARVHGTVVDTLTPADVNEAAKVFKPDYVTALILRPKSPNGPPAKPKPKS